MTEALHCDPAKKNRSVYCKRIFLWLLTCLSLMPVFITGLGGNLDDSWRYILNVAGSYGWKFGSDIFYTYGPLGFVTCPAIGQEAFLLHFLIYGIAFLYLSLMLYHFMVKTDLPDWQLLFIFALALLGLKLNSENYLVFVFLFSVFCSLYLSKHTYTHFIFASVLTVLFAFIKYNLFVLGFSTLMFSAVVFFLQNRKQRSAYPEYRREMLVRILCTLAVPAVIFVMLYAYCGSIPAVGRYLMVGIEITRGYSDAMTITYLALNIPILTQRLGDFYFLPAILGGAVYVLSLIYIFLYKRKMTLLWLLAFIPLFISYKHSYVRCDPAHFPDFSASIAIMLFLFSIHSPIDLHKIKKYAKPQKCLLSILCLLSAALILFSFDPIFLLLLSLTVAVYFLPALTKKTVLRFLVPVTLLIVVLVLGIPDRATKITTALTTGGTITEMKLPQEMIRTIRGQTVGIYPWDCQMSYNQDFVYVPQPLLQSFSVFTPALDELNAQFYSGTDAPQYLIFSQKAIDMRNMAWEAPLTWQTINENYEAAGKYSDLTLMVRRKTPISLTRKTIAECSVKIGETISVPDYTDNLGLQITLHKNALGSLVSLLYKTQPIYLFVRTDNGDYCFRTVPANMSEGILLTDPGAFTVSAGLPDSSKHILFFVIIIKDPAFYDLEYTATFYSLEN